MSKEDTPHGRQKRAAGQFGCPRARFEGYPLRSKMVVAISRLRLSECVQNALEISYRGISSVVEDLLLFIMVAPYAEEMNIIGNHPCITCVIYSTRMHLSLSLYEKPLSIER